MGSLIFIRCNGFFIFALEALLFRYFADGAGRSSADLVRSVSDIIRHPKDLLGLPIEEQVVITKVLLVHISEEILHPQAKTPFLATHRDGVKIKQLSFPWRLSCDNFVNFQAAWLFVSPSVSRNRGDTSFFFR